MRHSRAGLGLMWAFTSVTLLGCAKSQLAVHVDLWQDPERLPANKPQPTRLLVTVQSTQLVAADVIDAYKKELSRVKGALGDSEADQNQKRVYEALEGEADALSNKLVSLRASVEDLTSQAEAKAKSSMAAKDPEDRVKQEEEAQRLQLRAMAAARDYMLTLRQEVEPQTKGSRASVHLAFGLFPKEGLDKDRIDTIRKRTDPGAPDVDTAVASFYTRKADAIQMEIDASLGTNPDLLADDGDPAYPYMAHDDPGWRSDFFYQAVDADGKTAFLIVRETPVRYGIFKVSSNPTALINMQLRLARLGLNTVAEIAKSYTGVQLPKAGTGDKASDTTSSGMSDALAAKAQTEAVRSEASALAQRSLATLRAVDQNKLTASSFQTDVSPTLQSVATILNAVLKETEQAPTAAPSTQTKDPQTKDPPPAQPKTTQPTSPGGPPPASPAPAAAPK